MVGRLRSSRIAAIGLGLLLGCTGGTGVPAPQPLPAEPLVGCGGAVFTSDVLVAPPPGEGLFGDPPGQALREHLRATGRAPAGGHQVLARDGARVTYGIRDRAALVEYAEAERRGSSWRIARSGSCDVRTVDDGDLAVRWDLRQAADPESAVLPIQYTTGLDCRDRPSPLLDRVLLEETPERVALAVYLGRARRRWFLPAGCTGDIGVLAEHDVPLAAPLGDRAVQDAGAFPAAPPAQHAP